MDDYVCVHLRLMEKHECVREWLEFRPPNTQSNYGRYLSNFCDFADVTPEQFQNMPHKEARDLAWGYIKTFYDKPSIMTLIMSALKSFYRNRDGDTLPFDSRRGGKHYFNGLKRKRLATEHVPSPDDVYKIVDAAKRLRDKAMFLVLFQSGIRVNALCRLTYGMVREQLAEGKVPFRLRITSDLDTKIESYRIDFYDTFIGKEAIDMLHAYCAKQHRHSSDVKPLFLSSRTKKCLTTAGVWEAFRKCVTKYFPKGTMRVHTLRKAFKSQVIKSNIGRDYGELLMGHVLRGSQENYVSRQGMVEDLEEAYNKIDFSRSFYAKRQSFDEIRKEIALPSKKTDISNIPKPIPDSLGSYKENPFLRCGNGLSRAFQEGLLNVSGSWIHDLGLSDA
jgi:integrase